MHPFGFNVVIDCMPDIALEASIELVDSIVDLAPLVCPMLSIMDPLVVIARMAMVFATELSMLVSIVEVSIEELPIEEPPIEEPPIEEPLMDDEFIPMVVIEGESRPRPGPA